MKMKFIISVSILLLIGCASSVDPSELTLREKFEIGMENLENEKYLQAQVDFKQVVIRGTGTELGDDAQYYLAEAYYRNEEYMESIAEYEKLTRRMGFSPFVEDARYKICEAYRIESPKYFHDQEYTEKALERFQEFLDDYPNSSYVNDVLESITLLREKMGLKLYETGILYMKMDEFESAKMTFDRVISFYYDTDVIHQAHQGIVIALARDGKITEASEYLGAHKVALMENGLYGNAENAISDMEKRIAKETE